MSAAQRSARWRAKHPERSLEVQQNYRQRDPARYNKKQEKYRKRHPKKVAEVVWRNTLRRLYGITEADYNRILLAQGNGCAVCGKTAEENGRRLALDHDHKTGENRGILCDAHNKGIGLFSDDSDHLIKAAEYLKKWRS